jgi:hypothetical protein
MSTLSHPALAPMESVRQTLHTLLRRVGRRQAAMIFARAALVALAVAFVTSSVLLLADLLFVLGSSTRAVLRWVPPAAAFVALALTLHRQRRSLRPDSLALLIEAHHPSLEHLLPTILGFRGGAGITRLLAARAAAALERVDARGVARWHVSRPAQAAAIALGTVLLVLLVSPGGAAEALSRWLHPVTASGWSGRGALGIGGSSDAEAGAPRFERLTIRVMPPAYTGLDPFAADADNAVRALPGSVVRVSGRTPVRVDAVAAQLIGGGSVSVSEDAGRWVGEWTLAPTHRGLVLEGISGGSSIARRVIPLVVLPDRAPIVEMLTPERDLVLAAPRGMLPVSARATDDFGVATFQLAWVRSRGSGESFQYEEFAQEWAQVAGSARARAGSVTLDIARLGLEPGDALHLRAVARDGAGGSAASATRIVRIAREDEHDIVNTTIGFPLEGEVEPVLSQRMIIVLTEQLLARANTLDSEAFQAEAGRIAHEQARLRQRIGDQIYVRATGGLQDPDDDFGADEPHEPEDIGQSHTHDEFMTIDVNRPLMDVYNAMWSAERELRLIRPGDALPHERQALDLLQALRQAERVYSRAPQRAPPVDVAAARGTGRLVDAEPAARTARTPGGDVAALASQVADVVRRLGRMDAGAAALALSDLAAQVLAIERATDAGALLARAADHAARGDRSRAAELARGAHRALSPDAGVIAARAAPRQRAPAAATYLRLRTAADVRAAVRLTGRGGAPFAFATLRYQSGNWDSAPLVPTNIVHAIAQYTDIPVAPDGVVVDLAGAELFQHPFVFMTGHLPVRFTDEEARNLRAYVERGGFVFIDDHGHDIDAAFHRTVTAELARIFGADALRRLPNDHELYRAFFVFEDGPPNTPHELNGWGDGLVHEHLFAVMAGSRIGVLYSNKDYSSEWNYHYPNKRFLGLDNTRFAVNIIVYALTR